MNFLSVILGLVAAVSTVQAQNTSEVVNLRFPQQTVQLSEMVQVQSTCQRENRRTVYDAQENLCNVERRIVVQKMEDDAICTFNQKHHGVIIHHGSHGTVTRFRRAESFFKCVSRSGRVYDSLDPIEDDGDLGLFVDQCRRLPRPGHVYSCDIMNRADVGQKVCRPTGRVLQDLPSCPMHTANLEYNCRPESKVFFENYTCSKMAPGPVQQVAIRVLKSPIRDQEFNALMRVSLVQGRLELRALESNNAEIFLAAKYNKGNVLHVDVNVRNIKNIDDSVNGPLSNGLVNLKRGKMAFSISSTTEVYKLRFALRVFARGEGKVIDSALDSDDYYIESRDGKFEVNVDLRKVLREEGGFIRWHDLRDEDSLRVFVDTSLDLGTVISAQGERPLVLKSTRVMNIPLATMASIFTIQ